MTTADNKRANDEHAMTCSAKCWTPTDCPTHGERMSPFGRLNTIGDLPCCDNYTRSDLNPRHLFNEHDSTRHYTDPSGWAGHEAGCDECGPGAAA